MKIGVPKEIKNMEYRVGLTPSNAQMLVSLGHEVVVEKDAGAMIGFFDSAYEAAGAIIVESKKEVYDSGLIIKVKEPQQQEYDNLREGQTIFCYLHLAAEPKLTEILIKKKVTAIAFETIEDVKGGLPLLKPMSEIAGRISIQAGATGLQMIHGGRGVLLSGVPGVEKGHVTIIGGGVVGTSAATMAIGLGAKVSILDTSIERLRELELLYGSKIETLYSTKANLLSELEKADLVIGAVLIPGKAAPKLITKAGLKWMKKGAAIVDVAIDQGGCFETSKPTTHSSPYYVEEDVVHYCVTNMPGACARTATMALTNATMPYTLKLLERGVSQALVEDKLFQKGLNVCCGQVTHEAVANDLGYEYVCPERPLQGELV